MLINNERVIINKVIVLIESYITVYKIMLYLLLPDNTKAAFTLLQQQWDHKVIIAFLSNLLPVSLPLHLHGLSVLPQLLPGLHF